MEAKTCRRCPPGVILRTGEEWDKHESFHYFEDRRAEREPRIRYRYTVELEDFETYSELRDRGLR